MLPRLVSNSWAQEIDPLSPASTVPGRTGRSSEPSTGVCQKSTNQIVKGNHEKQLKIIHTDIPLFLKNQVHSLIWIPPSFSSDPEKSKLASMAASILSYKSYCSPSHTQFSIPSLDDRPMLLFLFYCRQSFGSGQITPEIVQGCTHSLHYFPFPQTTATGNNDACHSFTHTVTGTDAHSWARELTTQLKGQT